MKQAITPVVNVEGVVESVLVGDGLQRVQPVDTDLESLTTILIGGGLQRALPVSYDGATVMVGNTLQRAAHIVETSDPAVSGDALQRPLYVSGLVPPAPPGPSYAEFSDHLATLGGTPIAWGDTLPVGGNLLIQAANEDVGVMSGTSYGRYYRAASACRMVQHGLPSEAIYTQQKTGARLLFAVTASQSSVTGYAGLNRNGYESLGSSITTFWAMATRLIYWDDDLGAMECNPNAMTDPVPYTW